MFHITLDEVTIGFDDASTLHLPGADPLHTTIVHDAHDEYVLTMHGAGGGDGHGAQPGAR